MTRLMCMATFEVDSTLSVTRVETEASGLITYLPFYSVPREVLRPIHVNCVTT